VESWTVHLSGEIDCAASLALAPQLDELTQSCAGDLLFDLEGVTLMNSEGLKLLLASRTKMQRSRARREWFGAARAYIGCCA
jgi:anti-anti-sigma factor